MKKVELRFNETEIYDETAFLIWLSTCEVRLYYFEHHEDNKTGDLVVKLVGEPKDIKYCLEQLKLSQKEFIEESKDETISNRICKSSYKD